MEKKEPAFFDGNPKMIFVFGLVTGVAITSLLGGSLSLPEFDSGGSDKVVAAFDDAELADEAAAPTAAKTLAPVTADEHIRGDIENAKVVMVEYSDFECPFCSRHHPTMLDVMEEYEGDVAWVYRHMPLSFHVEAVPSALASECAAEQGKFWEYGDALFDNQSSLSEDYYYELAAEIGLNSGDFADCYESAKYEDDVNEDRATGAAAGATGTPATFVNGILVSGAVDFATLSGLIEQELEG